MSGLANHFKQRWARANVIFDGGEFRGRNLADWMETFARADEDWFVRERKLSGRPKLPPKKPVQSERWIDYATEEGYEPRAWALMRLSRKIGA